MGYGYSLAIVRKNSEADPEHIGVRLGQVCIARDVSVASLAKEFRVSRQTIYNWVCGVTLPKGGKNLLVEAYIAALT
jgi:transcriptional regulator with XRE-family HTH domain